MTENHNDYGKISFKCPFCGTYTQNKWVRLYELKTDNYLVESIVEDTHLKLNKDIKGTIVFLSKCHCCKEYSIWKDGDLVHPNISNIIDPHEHMPHDVKELYNEARKIVNLSPRSSTALLRLSLEKLLESLNIYGSNLNNKIQNLSNAGINERIIRALDALRVIGNQAVHTGFIDFEEENSYEISLTLFEVLNYVVEKLIGENIKIAKIYDVIPKNKRENLTKKRNKTT